MTSMIMKDMTTRNMITRQIMMITRATSMATTKGMGTRTSWLWRRSSAKRSAFG